MIKINDDLSVDPAAVKSVFVPPTDGMHPKWKTVLLVEIGNECQHIVLDAASRDEAQQFRRDIQHEINAALE